MAADGSMELKQITKELDELVSLKDHDDDSVRINSMKRLLEQFQLVDIRYERLKYETERLELSYKQRQAAYDRVACELKELTKEYDDFQHQFVAK